MPKTLMTIGAAAKSAGVAVDTVRYYEREGLLASATRTASGYRVFGAADVERLCFIRKAKALGFTLEGRLREEWETHLGVRDTFLWGLLASDWTAR